MPAAATPPSLATPSALSVPSSVVDLPVSALAGVGVKVAGQLEQMGINRIFDLLLHLPRSYEDRSRLVTINSLQDGQAALVEGRVVHVDNKRSGMTVFVEDGTAKLTLRFFKVYQSLLQSMSVGTRLRLFGEIKINRYGVQMHHPEYKVLTGNEPLENTGLQPIYPTIKGLHQNKLRTLVKLALQTVQQQGMPITVFAPTDWQSVAHLAVAETQVATQATVTQNASSDMFASLSQAMAQAVGESNGQSVSSTEQFSMSLFEALLLIHTPPMHVHLGQQTQYLHQLIERTHPACQRLIIEELTAHQLSMLYRRQQLHQYKAPKCEAQSPLANALLANLPFKLTNAQQRVINEITSDMVTSIPMLRLVQGDVGGQVRLSLPLSLLVMHLIVAGK